MTSQPWLSIILAAGLGTRMNSARPKVMHPVAGRPMVAHAVAGALQAGVSELACVIGPDMDEVRRAVEPLAPAAQFYIQPERLGTANAVLAARPALADFAGDVIILYADTPLLTPETLVRLRTALAEGAAVAVLGCEAADPAGYGRLIRDEAGALIAIREEKDASPAERAIRLCNSGVMAFRAGAILPILERIGNANAKSEYYLTDAVEIAVADGLPVAIVTCPEEEVMGVNDRVQLARAEQLMQKRLREAAMRGGATLIAPDTVTFSYDTVIGEDVTVEPNVFFGLAVRIENNAEIKANSYMEHAHIGEGAVVGPFARLRPGAEIGDKAKIGNFVEIKKAVIETGAKISHLSYIGDARVGAGANIGAGTIVCNYDGFHKHQTDIGKGAFVGSNSALVAPVTIGDGAYIGSGSVITQDVEPGALALERNTQKVIPGWAARNRERRQK
ncbi:MULTISPECIES: bifunctional UDP-N-acetylglucosamine diphosphorylase/glucosamine-1-phosphate N-acetyltransferase GlmU [Rhodomicrobium]|uniref:bifunctional UDP-N-acetylglucosamine diphosphorylase/glucosamine-1-phosphate N-acetyltransferase GlmU n=1 Tax=Rhodomicrobium TaxID=1068 RepID=UPI000B4BF500|nr:MULTISPECIES: bifunctional UDP-N-acetylglucosamine diphosphorylase/glucosamine-1-phosphate N-acetyltransferase GlmU [Rhodomicrobium]